MHFRRFLSLILITTFTSPALATPTDTAFTYQGRLKKSGQPVNATADLTFTLWDSAAAGTQIDITQTLFNTTLVDGLFTVDLGFDPTAFNGDGRWLEVSARSPAGSGAFTTLSPRQPILPTPYALFALNNAPGASLPSGLMVLSNSTTPPTGFSFTGHQLGATNPWVVKASAPALGNSLNLATAVNGKVYHVPSSSSLFSELNPATGVWTPLPSLPIVVNSGSLVGASGKVVFINQSFAPTYLFDPSTNAWTTGLSILTNRVTSAGELNGLVYTAGGFVAGNYSAVVETYDPIGNTWLSRAPLPAPRLSGSVNGVAGKLYYAGGTDSTGTIISTLYAYDSLANAWTTKAPLLSPRSAHGAAEVGGKLYIFGGAPAPGVAADSVDVYDPITDSWTRLIARLNVPRLGAGGAAVAGKLYSVAGLVPPSTPSAVCEELLAPPASFFVMIKN